jgi:hypothetical protein
MLAPPIQQSGWRVHGDIRAQTFLEMSALVWTSPSTQLFVRRSGTGPESIPLSRFRDRGQPKAFMPSGETAYSSWTTPMWRNFAVGCWCAGKLLLDWERSRPVAVVGQELETGN